MWLQEAVVVKDRDQQVPCMDVTLENHGRLAALGGCVSIQCWGCVRLRQPRLTL